MDKPSIGRIVHYVLPVSKNAGAHRPAIIVKINDDNAETVNLKVFTDGLNEGSAYITDTWVPDVEQDEEDADGGTWHWPERV